jgi:ornithine cyclodeaminase/alanine dehydrogenase-like protein (mu-crystallin family)
MKIIHFNDIQQLNISPTQCVDWVGEAFLLKNESFLPHKTSIKMDGNIFLNTMPCVIPSLNKMGVKIVSRYPQRIPALISEFMLYEKTTGKHLALMDADWITAMRTGAVAALAIQTLKKSNTEIYSFMGLGNTARATLLCCLSKLGNKPITVKLLSYKNHADDFIKRFEQFKNIKFVVVEKKEDFIRNSDVIVSCVTAADDLIGQDEWYEEGVLVVPVHTRGFQNCDLFFDKVFMDDTAHIQEFKNFHKFKYKEEISNVLCGAISGRTNDNERILAYNIGIALHDIFFASKIYDMFQNIPLETVSVGKQLDKFWI